MTIVRKSDVSDPDLCERLKQFRESLRLDQKAFAKLTDTAFRTYQDYELGKSPPKVQFIQRLGALGCNVTWLLTGNGQMLVSDATPMQSQSLSTGLPADGELMGRLNDALSKLYKDQGIRLSEIDKGRVLMEKYAEVIALAATPDEYETQIPVVIHRHRKALQASRAEPGSGKRTA